MNRSSAQRGTSMLVVLVLLSVMMLGGLALARMTEIATLASGNSAYREASLQASEVGLNTAYAAARAITDESVAVTGWYWPTIQATDTYGMPNVAWASAPEVAVGAYRVNYVVERMCTVATLTNALQDCLVKQVPQEPESRRYGQEAVDPPNARQFRITVRVTGPKDTQTFIQSLITKG
jgi:type IV pilus assembly protein PilX